MKVFGLVAVLGGALAWRAVGCDICSIYAAVHANGGGKGFYGGIAEQFTHFGTLQEDGHKIPNDGEFINSSVSQIFAGYNFDERIGLQLNVPMIYRWYGSATAHDRVWGIGDISLIGTFLAWKKSEEDYSARLTFLGGIKFPTGNPEKLDDPDFANGIGGHDLALGSGSYDGLIGSAFFTRWKKLFATAEIQYAIRTEGAFEHQYANDLTWSGGPGMYLALNDDYTLSLQALVSDEYKGKDTFSGVPDDDSAETVVALGPQLNFTHGENLSAHIGVDFPVSIYNSGVQVVPTYRIRAALTFRF